MLFGSGDIFGLGGGSGGSADAVTFTDGGLSDSQVKTPAGNTLLDVKNQGTLGVPVYAIDANVLPRTGTLAALKTLTTGGGELCQPTDIAAIVQLRGTFPSGVAVTYSPMEPGIWNGTTSTFNAGDGTGPTTPEANGKSLTLASGANTSSGTPGSTTVRGGDSNTGAPGGTVTVTGGTANAVNGVGGAITLKGGSGETGGAALVAGGDATTLDAGTLTVRGGDSAGGDVAYGGNLVIRGGNGNTTGGSVTISGGQSLGSPGPDDGGVTIADGQGNPKINVGANGGISFFEQPATPQITVTGSRAGGAALNSLLNALASYGLIVNSTTT